MRDILIPSRFERNIDGARPNLARRLSAPGQDRTTQKLRLAVDNIDILDLLPKVTVPTIVFHCLRDTLVPFDQGRRLAASISNVKLVALDSENHALLSDEPAWAKFVGEMEAFLMDEG